MARITPAAIALTSALFLVTACTEASSEKNPATAARPSGERPAVIAVIEAKGFEVLGEFDAPSGLRGYAGLAGQQPVAVYTTADGQHALIGTLIDAQGLDVGAKPLERLVSGPASSRTWAQLEASEWIADGRADAPRIVYTFSDPNCPFCNRFWGAARPWVDAGKVQLRHIMVGVIRADSANKVAAIMAANSPSAALHLNETNYAAGGIAPANSVPASVRATLDANQKLMVDLGFQGTPGILFLDETNLVQRRAGMPQADDLENVLGPL